MTNKQWINNYMHIENRIYMITPVQEEDLAWTVPCLRDKRFATEHAADKAVGEWLKEERFK